jgi:hypothetical protein
MPLQAQGVAHFSNSRVLSSFPLLAAGLRGLQLLGLMGLVLATSVAYSSTEDDELCSAPLEKSGIFDIRNYGNKGSRMDRRQLVSFDLSVQSNSSLFSLTVRPRGPGSGTLIQVVHRSGQNSEVERLLNEMAKEMAGLSRQAPDQAVYSAPDIPLDKLKEQMNVRARSLKGALVSDYMPVPSLPSSTPSLRKEAVRALLIKFLKDYGVDEEDRFYDVRMSAIHREFLQLLTLKEKAFFDYAIFSDFLGYEAETRAEKLQQAWLKVDPTDASSYEEVHQRIREKFLYVADRSKFSFRNQATYRLFVFEKVQADFEKWIQVNSLENIRRLENIAAVGVSDQDVNWLLSLLPHQEPRISWRTINRMKRILQIPPQSEAMASVKQGLTAHIRKWRSGMPAELIQQVVQIAQDGMVAEQLGFVLSAQMPKRLLRGLEAWDWRELKSIFEGKPNLNNFNPIGLEVDHQTVSQNTSVVLSEVAQSSGSRVEVGSDPGRDEGYSVYFFDGPRRTRRGLLDER